jgi:RNA polymerase primary sigma factor
MTAKAKSRSKKVLEPSKSQASPKAAKNKTAVRSKSVSPRARPVAQKVDGRKPRTTAAAATNKRRVSKVESPGAHDASTPRQGVPAATNPPAKVAAEVRPPEPASVDRSEERREQRGEMQAVRKSTLSQEFDAIDPYIRVARAHPPLTREREYELSRLARGGDEAARKLLVNHNVAFVLSMCRKSANKGCRLDDIVQEGMIGLLKAVEHFDPDKGNRFTTYASWWIRAYVGKYLRDMRATVKPVVTSPGQERFALPKDFSLDAPIGDDDDTTFLDRLEETDPSQEDRFMRGEHDAEVRAALERAKKRIGGLGWDIIRQRLEQEQPRTLEEIGKDWGLSRERVRQVEKSTRAFLERYLEPFAA